LLRWLDPDHPVWVRRFLTPGNTAWVLYDPGDHSKVVFDEAAMDVAAQAQLLAATEQAKSDYNEKIKALTDLRDRGTITEADFEAQKMKAARLQA
jgi:hypothetical protein